MTAAGSDAGGRSSSRSHQKPWNTPHRACSSNQAWPWQHGPDGAVQSTNLNMYDTEATLTACCPERTLPAEVCKQNPDNNQHKRPSNTVVRHGTLKMTNEGATTTSFGFYYPHANMLRLVVSFLNKSESAYHMVRASAPQLAQTKSNATNCACCIVGTPNDASAWVMGPRNPARSAFTVS